MATIKCAHLNQDIVHGGVVCDLIVHALRKPLGKVAEDERLGVILLVEVINVRNVEVLLGNGNSALVVGR